MHDKAATVRFASLARLQRDDIKMLRQMAGPIIRHPAGTTLQRANDPVADPQLLIGGWASSAVEIRSGGRQIVKVHMGGDLLGVTSLPFTRCVDTITALTELSVCTVSQAAIGALFQNNPRLAALLFLISLEERVMLVDRLVIVGRAETGQRIAALTLQLWDRLMRSEPATGLTFRLPLTQLHLADMIGVTTVHVSRILQDLASENLLKWDRGKITILSLEGLQRLAGFSPREMPREHRWLPVKAPS